MREILFRGKSITRDEFVYSMTLSGGTIKRKINSLFLEVNGNWLGVIPKTVGQYTGLKDKNGKKIFEGDRVHFLQEIGWCEAGNQPSNLYLLEGIIIYKINEFKIEKIGAQRLRDDGHKFKMDFYDNMGDCFTWNDLEIIGNIHENPELLSEN